MKNPVLDASPTDAVTFATLAAVMGSVSLLPRRVPARRATRVDPSVTLRGD